METYRRYFKIDPDFFPAVNDDVIRSNPDLWQKYYPHEDFKKLLKQALSVLERRQKLNIWVEGAYGTGKSHAVLTLKHLLDAPENELKDYFQHFKLDDDLLKRFMSVKKSGKIITVHRYGSSSIRNDNDLFFAMQESIEEALGESGITNAGSNALKEGVIEYLSDEENKQSINVYVKGSYRDMFAGHDVDDIIRYLKEFTGEALQSLMGSIFRLAKEKNIKVFTLDDSKMTAWITDVIDKNDIKAIVFIWDEFTDYFRNNVHGLSGFQRILDMSQTTPFCFIPVTHRSRAGIGGTESEIKRILGRFINPTCIISLPENMAFKLMGAAMQVNEDEAVKKEWEEIKADLILSTNNSRERIKDYAKIHDEELRNILPIHPYAASMLKQISESFASNQRSMFDFIKNTGNEENKGFQWFIDNHGPYGEPFLTIDLLWGFFYDKGKNDLSQSIRQILDCYGNLSRHLDEDEKKVLKAILLLQAMSQKAGDSIGKFLPNKENLENAFEGTQLEGGQAVKCANKLINDKIIYKKPQRDGSYTYSVHTRETDDELINKKEKEVNSTTRHLIQEWGDERPIELPHDLKLRFKITYIGLPDFDGSAKKAFNEAESDLLHFQVLACISQSQIESNTFTHRINQMRDRHPESDVIFIDCGKTPLGEDELHNWISHTARSLYYAGHDKSQSEQYKQYAKDLLNNWRTRIAQGRFVLYTKGQPPETHDIDALGEELHKIDRERFPLSLECNFKSINNWWESNNIQVGVECGVTRTLKGTYLHKNANLKNALEFAWQGGNEYWKDRPIEPISMIKAGLESFIHDSFKKDGRISILNIYSFLSGNKFGFLPCNMTAFFMGFLLKEYVSDAYSWSDGISTDKMTLNHMKEMVDEVIKLQSTNDSRYREKFIVTMTPEEKAFMEGTSIAYGILRNKLLSIESSRDWIRASMKDKLSFPILVLIEILNEHKLSTPTNVVEKLITDYQNLTNNTTENSDSDIALRIGRVYLDYKNAASDLSSIMTPENCQKGMCKYIETYKGGELRILAERIGNGGQYINSLRRKFNAKEANWLWKRETIDRQIDLTILEYQIAAETSIILGNVTSYDDAIATWNEKISNIKIALETVKSQVCDFLPLLSILKEIKSQAVLQENKKELFLELLRECGKKFNDFYYGQQEIFKKVCNFYLQGLEEHDKEKIFKKLPNDVFTLDNTRYSSLVERTVNDYKKNLGSLKIRNLWKEKTCTDSPIKWSDKHHMPILAMIPDEKQSEYRKIFDILNNPNPSEKDIEKGLNAILNFEFWKQLSSESARDKVFREKILADYSVLIEDIDNIKDYILNHVSESPYYWLGNGQVKEIIQEYALAQYNRFGYQKAMKKIDCMNANEARDYLKGMIRNNMTVGVQIIKDNR